MTTTAPDPGRDPAAARRRAYGPEDTLENLTPEPPEPGTPSLTPGTRKDPRDDT